jgi:phosphoribosylformylglycinamidine (FGAM) synthase-like enzyme
MTDAKINDFITKYVLKKDSLNRVLVSKRGLKTMVEAYNDIYKDKDAKERTVALSEENRLQSLNENQKKNLSVIEALTRGGNFATLVESGFLESMGFEKQVPKIKSKKMLEIELPIKTVDYFIETPKKYMESMPDMIRTGIEKSEMAKEDKIAKEGKIEIEPDGGMNTPPMEELEEEKEAEKPTPKLRGSISKPAEKPKATYRYLSC